MNNQSYLFLDIETTGLDYRKCAIMEIGLLQCDGAFKEMGEKSFFCKIPSTADVQRGALEVNGLEVATCNKEGKDPAATVEYLIKFLSRCKEVTGSYPVLVGHKITTFDLLFLERYFNTYAKKSMYNYADGVLDTLNLARLLQPNLHRYSLRALCEGNGISYEGAHRAGQDCKLNRDVLLRLLPNKKEKAKAAPPRFDV